MIVCHACRSPLKNMQDACPHCGAAPRRAPRLILAGVSLAMAASSAGCVIVQVGEPPWTPTDTPTQAETPTQTAEVTVGTPAVTPTQTPTPTAVGTPAVTPTQTPTPMAVGTPASTPTP